MASIMHRCSQVVSSSGRSMAPTPAARRHLRDVSLCSTQPNIEKTLFGEDFGARNATAAELASNFGEKVLGNWDTEHLIKPPDAIGSVMGLKARKCQPAESLQLLDITTRERYRQQVPGWRVNNNKAGHVIISQNWSARDGAAAEQLLARLREVADAEGHPLSAAEVVGESTAVAELTTASLGGLTENDFIVAAKINDLNVSDLLAKRRQRFWA